MKHSFSRKYIRLFGESISPVRAAGEHIVNKNAYISMGKSISASLLYRCKPTKDRRSPLRSQ